MSPHSFFNIYSILMWKIRRHTDGTLNFIIPTLTPGGKEKKTIQNITK